MQHSKYERETSDPEPKVRGKKILSHIDCVAQVNIKAKLHKVNLEVQNFRSAAEEILKF